MTFDEIRSGGEALLQETILLEAQESLQLDFKGSALFTPEGKLTKDGRRAISKALSAFSNSAGGVIVAGVDCRANSGEEPDVAQSLDPIPNWKVALSAINSAVGDLLQPKNDSLRVEGFPSQSDKTLGYLVIDVPRSERRPHMCQMTGRYFKRSGSATYPMEHHDVEDAFRRVAVPELKLRIDLHKFMASGSNSHYKIRLWLDNVSSVTAFFPSITISELNGIQFGWVSERLPFVMRINEADKVTAYGDSEFVIHPGSTRQIEAFEFHVAFDESRKPVVVGDREPHMAYLAFKYRIGARDMISREEEIEIPLFPFKW
jgi:schlafen family protein